MIGRPRGRGVIPVEARFWAKVDRRGYNDCWPWLGGTAYASQSNLVYGKFTFGPWELDLEGEKPVFRGAHRVAYRLIHGTWPLPRALHGCDYPLCCNAENPDHVHEGSSAQNTQEMIQRGRWVQPPVRTGIDASRAKLTDRQALEIAMRYRAGGVTQTSLGLEYGVSQHAISAIVTGKRHSLKRTGMMIEGIL